MQFIDSARFMTRLFSNLVNNISKEIHKQLNVNRDTIIKTEAFGIKYN